MKQRMGQAMTELFSKNLFPLIGKSVKDEYEREIGHVVSFMVSPNGRVNGVLIKHEDGKFLCHPSRQLKVKDNNDIMLVSDIKIRANALCKEIPLIWRKDQVLSSLREDRKIPPETYDEFHHQFDDALNRLKADAKTALDELDGQVGECTKRFKTLHLTKTYLEIEHEMGGVDDDLYRTSIDALMKGLKQTITEKNDLEEMRAKLSSLLVGEAPSVEPRKDEGTEERKTQEQEEQTKPSEETVSPLEPIFTIRVK